MEIKLEGRMQAGACSNWRTQARRSVAAGTAAGRCYTSNLGEGMQRSRGEDVRYRKTQSSDRVMEGQPTLVLFHLAGEGQSAPEQGLGVAG